MLKKYTKYAATAFAVASLSTFMIGCGEAEDTGPLEEQPSAPAVSQEVTDADLDEGKEGKEGKEGE